MLRLASPDKTYDLTIKVANQPVKLMVRSMTLMERTDLVSKVGKEPKGTGGLEGLVEMLSKLIVHFDEYPDRTVVDVLGQIEHLGDLQEIAKGVIDWSFLPESESKNLYSSPVQSTPESAGNAVNNAGAERVDV